MCKQILLIDIRNHLDDTISQTVNYVTLSFLNTKLCSNLIESENLVKENVWCREKTEKPRGHYEAHMTLGHIVSPLSFLLLSPCLTLYTCAAALPHRVKKRGWERKKEETHMLC